MSREEERRFKERIKLGKTLSAEIADKQLKIKKQSEDSRIRKAINLEIIKGIAEGKNRLTILLELSSNPDYKKYSKYFTMWINDRYTSKQKEKEKDESERA